MATLKIELPDNLVKQLEVLEKSTEQTFSKMTKAGAEVAYKNIVNNMQNSFKSPKKMQEGLKITRTYRAKTKGTIGNFVGFYGYIPFSDPNRKFFARKGSNGQIYKTDKGVPRDFLAKVAEYGTSKIDATPFLRKSFKKKEINESMQKVLQKEIEKVIK